MIVLIDNYDSFTYNLFHYLGELGVETLVHRNDQITPDAVLALKPEAIILSPGPCTPNEAGICLDLIRRSEGRVPLLGVCLGHQAIGQAYGGKVVRAPYVMHGKTSQVRHWNTDIFEGLDNPFTATRYHSLVVDRDSLPECLAITAESEDGIIMGLAHKQFRVYGVQFHPESIATQQGHLLLANFLRLAGLNPVMPAASVKLAS